MFQGLGRSHWGDRTRVRDEAVGGRRGDMKETPTHGKGASKDPVLPSCLF